jgi:hypothetical protein
MNQNYKIGPNFVKQTNKESKNYFILKQVNEDSLYILGLSDKMQP